MRGPDVHRRRASGIVIQRRHAEDDMRLGRPFRHEMGAAGGAETAYLAGENFVCGEPFFSPQPTKMVALDPCRGREGTGVRLAARSAMAMHDLAVQLRDLVGDRAAQTLSLQVHAVSLPVVCLGVMSHLAARRRGFRVIASISSSVTVSAGMKRSVSARGALISNPRPLASSTTSRRNVTLEVECQQQALAAHFATAMLLRQLLQAVREMSPACAHPMPGSRVS